MSFFNFFKKNRGGFDRGSIGSGGDWPGGWCPGGLCPGGGGGVRLSEGFCPGDFCLGAIGLEPSVRGSAMRESCWYESIEECFMN